VEVGFQYRRRHDPTQPQAEAEPWQETKSTTLNGPGRYSVALAGLKPGQAYEYRAVVKHPRITLYGDLREFQGR
jgi:alpha-L-fucosidase